MRFDPREDYLDFAIAFAGTKEERSLLFTWMAGSLNALRKYRVSTIAEGAHMQREFTIQLRVDFADSDKLEPIQNVLKQAARHALATARLISDNPKSTQVVIFSDDFFHGHQEISLLDDVIQQGLDAIGESTGAEHVSGEIAEGFSSELADALK